MCIDDQAIVTPRTRFQQCKEYKKKKTFDFLFTCDKLKSFDDTSLKSHCSHLKVALKNGERFDIDVNEFYVDLRFALGPTDI